MIITPQLLVCRTVATEKLNNRSPKKVAHRNRKSRKGFLFFCVQFGIFENRQYYAVQGG